MKALGFFLGGALLVIATMTAISLFGVGAGALLLLAALAGVLLAPLNADE